MLIILLKHILFLQLKCATCHWMLFIVPQFNYNNDKFSRICRYLFLILNHWILFTTNSEIIITRNNWKYDQNMSPDTELKLRVAVSSNGCILFIIHDWIIVCPLSSTLFHYRRLNNKINYSSLNCAVTLVNIVRIDEFHKKNTENLTNS